MWNRSCAMCFVKVPRILVLTRGDELSCASCRTPLEISRPSRVLGALVGLIAGFVAADVTFDVSAVGRWVLPVVAAVLAYGCASALVLYVLSDLVVRLKLSADNFPHSRK
jgi:hypothetical protein